MGGDEFAVLFSPVASPEEVVGVTRRALGASRGAHCRRLFGAADSEAEIAKRALLGLGREDGSAGETVFPTGATPQLGPPARLAGVPLPGPLSLRPRHRAGATTCGWWLRLCSSSCSCSCRPRRQVSTRR